MLYKMFSLTSVSILAMLINKLPITMATNKNYLIELIISLANKQVNNIFLHTKA